MMQPDYYEILQVKESARQEEIRNAHRKLLKKYDPHGSSPDALKLKEVNDAYRVLGDPDRRAAYDAELGLDDATPLREQADEAPLDEEAEAPVQPRRRRPLGARRPARDPIAEEGREWRARGQRTRYDRRGRNLLLLGAVVFTIVLIIAIVLIALNAPAPGQRAFDVRPRSLDIWSVYPNGQVRFVTLFYPDPEGSTESSGSSVQMAGPLVTSADNILATSVMGGAESGMELQAGPSGDEAYFFPMFTIEREIGPEMYGIDVMTTESPYLSSTAGGPSMISLGIEIQNVYTQVIVAVAVPRDAEVIPIEDASLTYYPSYRHTNVGEWQVYYFDTTQATSADPNAIRLQFTPGVFMPDDLDPAQVDRRR